VVPSFAKPAKLGQPLSPMCGQETLKMGQPPEGGPKGLEDRVKRAARPGSVVPSFAKPAKLGQPLSPMCGQETLKMGQPPATCRARKRKGMPVSTPFPPLTFTSFTTPAGKCAI
jgi:hypothetical protein